MTWRKIAKCDAGACVEVRELPGVVEVRSSRHPTLTVEFTKDEWDAFLAGLGATESAERGEVVGEAAGSDVELVARTIAMLDPQRLTETADWVREAKAILIVLGDRLLPPVVQTREEWGEACAPPECPLPHEMCCYADGSSSHKHTHVRTISTFADDGSPYGGATLTSAWREVSES